MIILIVLRGTYIHSYNTRRKNYFRLPLVRRKYGKHRLYLYQGIPEEWNFLEGKFRTSRCKTRNHFFFLINVLKEKKTFSASF